MSTLNLQYISGADRNISQFKTMVKVGYRGRWRQTRQRGGRGNNTLQPRPWGGGFGAPPKSTQSIIVTTSYIVNSK